MCSYCGAPMLSDRKPGFNESCETCGRDLHACVNCRFYKPGMRWDCAETVGEQVVEKERRNLCDWYETAPALFSAHAGKPGAKAGAEKAKSDFERLFGGGA